MAKFTKQEALRILYSSASNYEEKLSQRRFRLIYLDKLHKSMEMEEVIFQPESFKHLTGIQTKISAFNFYEACLDRRLSQKTIAFDARGNTQRKLEVIEAMPDVFYHPCWIGESLNNDIHIHAAYYVGDTKCVLSIGFRNVMNKSGDVPITLKKQSIREVVTKECKVYAIASKSLLDKNSAWQLTYCARDFDPVPWITDGR